MHTESWQSVGPTLDECIKCNICASYCPVAAVTEGALVPWGNFNGR